METDDWAQSLMREIMKMGQNIFRHLQSGRDKLRQIWTLYNL